MVQQEQLISTGQTFGNTVPQQVMQVALELHLGFLVGLQLRVETSQWTSSIPIWQHRLLLTLLTQQLLITWLKVALKRQTISTQASQLVVAVPSTLAEP